MPGAFDQIAEKYDDEFTNSSIGKLQRQVVWNYLEILLKDKHKLNILELNCGTGEDALWLAQKGHNVLATDVSAEMIRVAKIKADSAGLSDQLSFSTLDLLKPATYPTDVKFDLVFSNFGGFNCISPDSFRRAMPVITKLLKSKGRLIAVIMPKFCLWESLYFIAKRKPSEVLRRNRSVPVKVSIGSYSVDTWYYSPSDVTDICKKDFKIQSKLPVGIFIPPSYLNTYFSSHPRSLQHLKRLEESLGSLSVLAGIADHYIIDMEAKS